MQIQSKNRDRHQLGRDKIHGLSTAKTGPPFALRWGINYAYMKTLKMLSVLALVFCGTFSYGQAVEAEVPGDNFSLEGALELFKQSDSPEEFERLLNSPDSKVNNLDLNGDGYIDYIRVHDRYQGRSEERRVGK